MSNDIQITIRVPEQLVKRAEKLVKAVEKDPDLRTFGRPSKSSVMRLALLYGLNALDRKYSKK